MSKKIADYLGLFFVLPLIAHVKLSRLWTSERKALRMPAEFLAQVPGSAGVIMRRMFYQNTLARCDSSVVIGYGSVVFDPETDISADVSIGTYCLIGRAQISAGAQIASRVSLISGTSQHLRPSAGELSKQTSYQLIKIGQNVWIGEGAIVAAEISSGSNVGPGAVVLKAITEQNMSVIGNPARVLPATQPYRSD